MLLKTKVNIIKLNENAKIPTYGSAYSAGADLSALISNEQLIIPPHQTTMVHTGIAIELPKGTVGLICARSGLAKNKALAPANKVGVIDSDYRGELMIALHNHSDKQQCIENGERIAQLMIVPYVQADFEECKDLSDTQRGAGGFGSTGTI